jgi:outer membrane protein assembly factor BamC
MPLNNLPMGSLLMPKFKMAGLILAAMTVSACSLFGGDERPVYQGAEYYKNLEVPPELTRPDTAEELKVPKPTDEAMQRFRDNNKLETVITPKFDGVRVVSYAGNSWIEIDNNVEQVWPRLLEFWKQEGIELVEVRPMLGYMETDWMERLGGDVGFFRSMFQKIEPDQKDKFRLRVERFDNDRKTRLYIAHSRIERVIYGEYADGFIWVTLPSDVEAEREIISRMALFAGINDEQALQLLENYRPYTSLVKVDSTNATTLTMTGSMDFVWRRAMRALDRMGMQDIQPQKENSTINFVAAKISAQSLHVEEDELSKSSWIMQLFTGADEKDLADDKSRNYRLEFTDLNGRIQLAVKDVEDTTTTDEEGTVRSTARVEQLRNLLVDNLE